MSPYSKEARAGRVSQSWRKKATQTNHQAPTKSSLFHSKGKALAMTHAANPQSKVQKAIPSPPRAFVKEAEQVASCLATA